MTTVLQILTYGIINGAMYGLVALGLSLVFGVMSYLNVAHGALIVLGAYASFWLFHLGNVDPFISVVIIAPAFFALGLALFKGLFAPLIVLSEDEKIKMSLLISFGILLIIPNLTILLWTPDERAVTAWYSGMVIRSYGWRLPYIGLGTLLLSGTVITAIHLFLTRTYFGKAIRAVSQDHEAAGLMGINVKKTYLISFGIGVALAAVPGAVVSFQGFNPDLAFDLTNKALVVVILAGVGSIHGVLTAGLLLGLLEAVGVFLLGAPYRQAIGLVVFVLFLIYRPQGLTGKKA